MDLMSNTRGFRQILASGRSRNLDVDRRKSCRAASSLPAQSPQVSSRAVDGCTKQGCTTVLVWQTQITALSTGQLVSALASTNAALGFWSLWGGMPAWHFFVAREMILFRNKNSAPEARHILTSSQSSLVPNARMPGATTQLTSSQWTELAPGACRYHRVFNCEPGQDVTFLETFLR